MIVNRNQTPPGGRTNVVTSAVLWLCVLGLVATHVACSSCRSESRDAISGPSAAGVDAQTPEGVTARLAAYAPGDVDVFFALRDWEALFEAYAAAKPRINALVGNVGMIEADLRNTLRVDVTRVASLAEIGVDTGGGMAILAMENHLVYAVLVSDADRFVSTITEIAQGQPFNLRAPVQQTTRGPLRVSSFRRAPDGNARLSVAVRGDTAFVIPQTRRLDAILERLSLVTNDNSLSSHDSFGVGLREMTGTATYGQINMAASAAHQAATLRDRGVDPFIVADVEASAAFGTLTLGADLTPDRLAGRALLIPDADLLTQLHEALGSDDAANFSRLISDDVYVMLRGSLNVGAALDTFFARVSPPRREAVNQAIFNYATQNFVSLPGDVVEALGSNAMLLATRARLLTLRRVLQAGTPPIGDVFTGFGIVIAIEVRDRAKASILLDRLLAPLGDRASRYERDGHSIVQFTDAEADIGNIVLTDDLLILVPERNRNDLMEQLASDGAPESERHNTPMVRSLIRDASTSGIFIDIAAILNGPIGTAAGPMLPNELRRGLANFDTFSAHARPSDEGIVFEVALEFSELPETP